METKSYHNRLKDLMDSYVHLVYALSRTFPKERIVWCNFSIT